MSCYNNVISSDYGKILGKRKFADDEILLKILKDYRMFFHYICQLIKDSLKTGSFRSSRSQMFFKTGVLKNFAIFTGKKLFWSLKNISRCCFCSLCVKNNRPSFIPKRFTLQESGDELVLLILTDGSHNEKMRFWCLYC